MELRAHDVVFWRDARAATQRSASELRCGAFAIELQLAAVLREEFRFGDEFLVRLTRGERRPPWRWWHSAAGSMFFFRSCPRSR
jgi:hypothetical protein